MVGPRAGHPPPAGAGWTTFLGVHGIVARIRQTAPRDQGRPQRVQVRDGRRSSGCMASLRESARPRRATKAAPNACRCGMDDVPRGAWHRCANPPDHAARPRPPPARTGADWRTVLGVHGIVARIRQTAPRDQGHPQRVQVRVGRRSSGCMASLRESASRRRATKATPSPYRCGLDDGSRGAWHRCANPPDHPARPRPPPARTGAGWTTFLGVHGIVAQIRQSTPRDQGHRPNVYRCMGSCQETPRPTAPRPFRSRPAPSRPPAALGAGWTTFLGVHGIVARIRQSAPRRPRQRPPRSRTWCLGSRHERRHIPRRTPHTPPRLPPPRGTVTAGRLTVHRVDAQTPGHHPKSRAILSVIAGPQPPGRLTQGSLDHLPPVGIRAARWGSGAWDFPSISARQPPRQAPTRAVSRCIGSSARRSRRAGFSGVPTRRATPAPPCTCATDRTASRRRPWPAMPAAQARRAATVGRFICNRSDSHAD